MKNVLLAFDGTHFSDGALEFVRQMNAQSPIMVKAAFLPQVDYANLWSFSGGGLTGKDFVPLVEDEGAEIIKKNRRRVEAFCLANKIKFIIQKDYFNFAIPELKKESIYADLLVLSSETFYMQAGVQKPNEYLKEVLHEVECPVIVLPEAFEFPNCNILSCDGTEGTIYALKQFACLFPEWTSNPTTVVHAVEGGKLELPNEDRLRGLITTHYPNVSWPDLSQVPKRYFGAWLQDKKAAIVVSGAFGRSGLSLFFKKSFITEIISEHRLPVFIAHK